MPLNLVARRIDRLTIGVEEPGEEQRDADVHVLSLAVRVENNGRGNRCYRRQYRERGVIAAEDEIRVINALGTELLFEVPHEPGDFAPEEADPQDEEHCVLSL